MQKLRRKLFRELEERGIGIPGIRRSRTRPSVVRRPSSSSSSPEWLTAADATGTWVFLFSTTLSLKLHTVHRSVRYAIVSYSTAVSKKVGERGEEVGPSAAANKKSLILRLYRYDILVLMPHLLQKNHDLRTQPGARKWHLICSPNDK